jgi:hypothetical protein
MDSKLGAAQADPHHDGDVVLLAPKDWTDAEEALSELAHVALDKRRSPARSDFSAGFSAGPRMIEPSLDATLRLTELNIAPAVRPSPRWRTSRSLAGFLLTVCVGVAATLAWQSYGDTAKQMIASSAPPLAWVLSSSPPTDPPSGRESARDQPYPSAAPAPTPQAAPAQAGVVESAAPRTVELAAPVTPAELQQLQTMAHDLAAVHQRVEELAAGQEQMARDIAKLQAAGQDMRRRISALPPAIATTARKPIPPPQPAPAPSATAAAPAAPQPGAQ